MNSSAKAGSTARLATVIELLQGVGERLKEERLLLGLSQGAFGALGGVKKLAQINYEKAERNPDAAYFVRIALAGANVGYILTGESETNGIPRTFAERLKAERNRLGWSQSALGEIANVSRRTVIDWEKGATSPNATQLMAMAAYGLNLHYALSEPSA